MRSLTMYNHVVYFDGCPADENSPEAGFQGEDVGGRVFSLRYADRSIGFALQV